MKIKKWYIYILAVFFFVGSYITLNAKYDPFYRVNGINNDNRALIEQYLDEQQQQYLIDNAIAVNMFIQYIDVPGFYLPNYQYYNLLATAKVFRNKEDLVSNANTIVSRLEVVFGDKSLTRCKELVSNNLLLAFLYQESFDFQNIEYYQTVRKIYDMEDYQYIEHTNMYVTKFQNEGIIETQERQEIFRVLLSNYDKDSLYLLLTTPLQEGTTIVYNPSALGTIVNQKNFIGSYGPKSVVAVTDIPRKNWTMYMEEESYKALALMYEDLRTQVGEGLILIKSYRSYELLRSAQESLEFENPGYNEYQLGTTIRFQQEKYSLVDFDTTSSYQWLVENSFRYGFILRYPSGKEENTGHAFDGTVYRYVGVELATLLYEQQLSLEEYEWLQNNQKEQENIDGHDEQEFQNTDPKVQNE